MRGPLTWALLLSISGSAVAVNFDSPEHAVHAFEDAYIRGDADAAVVAWDFEEEIRRPEHVLDGPVSPPRVTVNGATAGPEGFGAAPSSKLWLLDQMHKKVRARFERWTCSIVRQEKPSPSLARLTERCDAGDGHAYSQELLVHFGVEGWHLVQYPSWNSYEPVCFTDAPSGITVCSERDGQHVSAVKNGRQLWRMDSVKDWKIWRYRTLYPVVVSLRNSVGALATNPNLRQRFGTGPLVMINYDSSEYGAVAVNTGKFQVLGLN